MEGQPLREALNSKTNPVAFALPRNKERDASPSEGAIWLGSIYETADSPDSTIPEERRGREEKDGPLVLSFSIEFCFLGCGIGRIPKTLYPSPKEAAFEPDPLPIHSPDPRLRKEFTFF
uniref:Uncharacterized protein n=1 Tax=Vespula pensylvanica TaxID=30213 RepID=A0A834MZ93_VESPE|nr:hypothetical protein H0235_017749 [Vespula pensylvanica]